MSKRTKFTVAGKHPLLTLLRDYLLKTTYYELVPWDAKPKFCIYGGVLCKGDNFPSRIHSLSLDYEAMKGTPTILLTPGLGRATDEPLTRKSIFSNTAKELFVPTGMCRTFQIYPVYGPDVKTGIVPTFINKAKQGQELYLRSDKDFALGDQASFLEAFHYELIRESDVVHLGAFNGGTNPLHVARTVCEFLGKSTDLIIPGNGAKARGYRWVDDRLPGTYENKRSMRSGLYSLCK